jgi:hypothetical protein
MPDPVHHLQHAARCVGSHLAPGVAVRRVAVFDEQGRTILDVLVPPGVPEKPPEALPGWDFSGNAPRFDGEQKKILGRSLQLLRVLAETDGPVSAEQLRAAWPDYTPSESTIRNQVADLRKRLKTAFPSWEGECITSTGAGYQLHIR